MRAAATVGVPLDLPELEGANVKMKATLMGFTATSTTFRVTFTQGPKQLADSTVNVTRGGRAVVGGTDGEAAPYIFVFVEPETNDAGQATGATPPRPPGITQPVLIRGGGPAYPEEARKSKITGSVLINLIVGADGKVEDARAIEYPDESLAQAALAKVRLWEFQPAHDERGNPLRVKITVTLNFQLK
jgi:TonB family protein